MTTTTPLYCKAKETWGGKKILFFTGQQSANVSASAVSTSESSSAVLESKANPPQLGLLGLEIRSWSPENTLPVSLHPLYQQANPPPPLGRETSFALHRTILRRRLRICCIEEQNSPCLRRIERQRRHSSADSARTFYSSPNNTPPMSQHPLFRLLVP